jgi:hypothetical protein
MTLKGWFRAVAGVWNGPECESVGAPRNAYRDGTRRQILRVGVPCPAGQARGPAGDWVRAFDDVILWHRPAGFAEESHDASARLYQRASGAHHRASGDELVREGS